MPTVSIQCRNLGLTGQNLAAPIDGIADRVFDVRPTPGMPVCRRQFSESAIWGRLRLKSLLSPNQCHDYPEGLALSELPRQHTFEYSGPPL
jgi:hypothetical protein